MFSKSFKQAENQWTKVGAKLFVFNDDPVEVGDNFDSCLGFYDPGKKLMVKRMLVSDESLERMERECLWMEAWDKHQNILDWVSLDRDDRYLYLSQERWSFTLESLVKYFHSLDTTSRLPPPKPLDVFIQKNSVTVNQRYIDGLMVELMEDVGKGLTHLHQMGYVHRDLRPQNIVIVCGTKSISAKIANFCFTEDRKMNRFKLKKICKSKTEFQPPEQKENYSRRELCKSTEDKSTEMSIPLETKETDLYSFGCLLYYSLTLGGCPYGANQYVLDLSKCKNEEAKGLLPSLLDTIPNSRSKVPLLNNPLFWSVDQKLNFLRDASDIINTNGTAGPLMGSQMQQNLVEIVGTHGKWEKLIDSRIITHMEKDYQKKTGKLFPPQQFVNVGALMRLLRNQYTHFFELSPNIQAIYSGTLEGMLEYYCRRFPTLLKIVYMEFGGMQHAAFKEFKIKYYS